MIIDFKEIPIANSGIGDQDTFEKFSRDFLEYIGYKIIGEPSRGADGGIDIKVLENRVGIGGITEFHWLVSCKHYAHSGTSISPSIEQNIADRVFSNSCHGFIGFYSTIASNGLKVQLEGLSNKISYQLFDNQKIENRIIGISKMENLFMRYFSQSYKTWKELYYYTEPINLFNFYLEKQYEGDKKLLEQIFGSTGNIIKEIRNKTSFDEALETYNIKIMIEPLLFNYIYGSQILEYNKLENYNFKDLAYEHLPNEMKFKYNIEINPEPICLSFLLSEKTSYILYSNILLVNENKYEDFNKLFNNLKSMII